MTKMRLALAVLAAAMAGCGGGHGGSGQSAAWSVKPGRVLLLDIARNGSGLVSVGERGLVLSVKAGSTDWTSQQVGTTRALTAVAFGDGGVGVAVGHAGSMFRTEDDGVTWGKVDLPDVGNDSILGIKHMGGARFVAFGVFGLLIESGDAGKSWARRPIKLPPPPGEGAGGKDVDEDFDRHIYDIVRFGEQLILIGESGTLARSADAGQTWKRIASPYAGSYFGAVVTAKNALLVYGMRGSVYRSDDGGANWAKIDLKTLSGINGGIVLPDGRIVLVGNNGLLAISGDDGASFKTATTYGGRDIAKAESGPNGSLLVVGGAGVRPVDLSTLKI